MIKTIVRLLATIVLAAIPLAIPAAAQTATSYRFNTTVAGDDNRIFAGSFSILNTGGSYSLASFSGSYNGYVYDLGNTGAQDNFGQGAVVGGRVNGVDLIIGGFNDFFIFNVTPSSSTVNYRITRPELNTIPGGTLELTAVPEPASWAMMVVGIGVLGSTLRRRHTIRTTLNFA